MEKLSIILGKLIQKIIRITGRGGSAFPGLVVEKINPNFIKNVLARLPHGVLVISGTNGKTTTTKIVTEILEKQGLKVLSIFEFLITSSLFFQKPVASPAI